MSRTLLAGLLLAALAGPLSATAQASWSVAGSGSSAAAAATMPAGNRPVATVSGRNVTVTWTASSGTVPVLGYLVQRYTAGGQLQSIGAACSGPIGALTCVEAAVPAGQWTYTTTPVRQNWHGAESLQSAAVTVAAPSLTLSPTTVNSLPATLTGSLTSFITGQTVALRLDDPISGTLLAGTITPNPIGSSGTSSVSVTLPAGVADGTHTVYAVDSAGDQASAAISVATSCSAPGSVTLSAGQDSYVDSLASLGNANYGSSTSLRVQPGYVIGLLAEQHTLVQFSLPAVPARCTLTAATLRLYDASPTGGRTIQAWQLAGSWTESGVTWNNAPGTTGTAASSASPSSAGWEQWGVLSIVQAMYSGSNYGFLVRDSAINILSSPSQVYQSREGSPAGQDPQLVLTFG